MSDRKFLQLFTGSCRHIVREQLRNAGIHLKKPFRKGESGGRAGEALAEGLLILTGFRNPVVPGQKLSVLIYDDMIRRMLRERTAEEFKLMLIHICNKPFQPFLLNFFRITHKIHRLWSQCKLSIAQEQNPCYTVFQKAGLLF